VVIGTKQTSLSARTIQFRLLAAVIGVSAVFFVLFGAAAVTQISNLTRTKVHGEALGLVAVRAQEIEGFFAERASVVTTVLANPTMLDWFANYDQFRRPLAGDTVYASIIDLFHAVEGADPDILEVFFATDSTSEYFRSGGRVEREGYDPKQRWWWAEAVGHDRLYVSPPGVDAGTGQVAVTVQTTVYLPDGRFLGIGGIDVQLGTLGALVGDITYQGVGDAFLVDNASQIIYFPELEPGSYEVAAPLSTPLADVDQLSPESSGFAELAARILDRQPGLDRVRWQGDDRIVVHTPVTAEEPHLEWTLGLMVPEELISSTIVRARVHSALSVLVAVITIAGFTLLITNRINSRLREEARRRADVLAEANVRLLEADRMKSQFLATMSHELRTPLNSIIGFSEILRTRLGDQLQPTFLRFLDNIHSSGEHLLSMISDILDLSKVEAGRMDLHPETLNVAKILDSVCAIVQGVAKERQVAVIIEAAEDLPPLEADQVRLKQILFNLLSNAVKFSLDNSEVRMVARELQADDSPLATRSIELSVIDSGIGISDEDRGLIFEQFRQVDGTGARKHGGTGLGLALVKRLVELHRGTITVDSTVDEGSTFRVILPVSFGTPLGDAVSLQPTTSPERPSGRTILVVEDDDAAYEAIRQNLITDGYRTVRSRDGSDAVDLVERVRPIAIVLDIILPQTDGWAILREVKARPAISRIPTIIVSVLDNHELGLALGADAYFTKPVDRERLLARLAELAPDTAPAEPRVLLIDDDPQLHEMVGEVLGPAGYKLAHAFSGIDGLALARTQHADLIILDLMMEGMDGFEVAHELRRDAVTRDVPVVVFTALQTTPGDRRRLQGKIQALVEKGQTQAPGLLPIINDLLGRRGTATPTSESEPSSTAQPAGD
jgi:signal transduction histidine kinase/CheY-like chemotaxis protein